MTITIRVADRADIPGMHRVRLAVRENRLISSTITEATYVPAIEQWGRGWVAEEHGVVVGFAIGNKTNGNVWALFVDPRFEGRGVGRRLQDAMLQWLFAEGVPRLWLTTDPESRARRFYEATGWNFVRTLGNGEVEFERHGAQQDPSRAIADRG